MDTAMLTTSQAESDPGWVDQDRQTVTLDGSWLKRPGITAGASGTDISLANARLTADSHARWVRFDEREKRLVALAKYLSE
jgi:hypothetical protein